MKSLKYIIAALVLAIGFAAPAINAQDAGKQQRPGGGGRGFTPEARVQRMTEQLKLTDEQQKKILAIYQADAKKMEGLSQEERRGKMQEINQASEPKVLEVLTPEQQTKYKEMMQNMRQRGGGKGGDKGGGKGGGKGGKGGGNAPKTE